MTLITWSKQLSVGISLFDEQHKEILNLINELHNAMLSNNTREVIGDLLNRLEAYTMYHFAAEEKMMQEHEFPRYLEHKEAHNDMALRVEKMIKCCQSGKSISIELMSSLISWLDEHIKGEDKEYGSFFSIKGIN